MVKAVLAHKAVFHVPLRAWIGGKAERIEGIGKALDGLVSKLAENGSRSMYATRAKGCYEGREYPEILLTVFGDLPAMETAIRTFVEWNALCRDELKQESFAYESDGVMCVCRFEAGEAGA